MLRPNPWQLYSEIAAGWPVPSPLWGGGGGGGGGQRMLTHHHPVKCQRLQQ